MMSVVAGRGTHDASAPVWILRHHTPSPLHALKLLRLRPKDAKNNDEHVYILAGDAEGRVSLSALRDVRPRLFWKAHASSVLSVDIVAFDRDTLAILTSGRDNELVAWRFAPQDASLMILPSRIQDDIPKPEKLASFGINALNYCAFSTCQHNGTTFVAMPHSMDSGYIDIITLPSGERTSRAIGKPDIVSKGNRAPMIMSMHIFELNGDLHVFAGYEDGYVKLWRVQIDGAELCWSGRKHSESIMATAVSHDGTHAVSVGADDVVASYDLKKQGETVIGTCKSMGHASVTIRKDDQIAVGGWDGSVRVSDKSLQRTAKLQYHKDTVQVVATLEDHVFARDCLKDSTKDDSDSEISSFEEAGNDKAANRLEYAELFLLSGGKEGRICLWRLP